MHDLDAHIGIEEIHDGPLREQNDLVEVSLFLGDDERRILQTAVDVIPVA